MDFTNHSVQCMKTGRVNLFSYQAPVQLYTNAFPLLPITPLNRFYVAHVQKA